MTKEATKRFNALKYILSHEYNAIIIVSFLTLVSFVPFFVWYGFKYFTDASIYSGLLDDLSNKPQIASDLFTNQIIFSLISIIAIPVSFILFGGAVGYLCELNLKLSRPLIKTYFSAIKKTFKYSLLVGFVTAFAYNLCALIKWGNNSLYSTIFIAIIVLAIIFIYPPLFIILFEGYLYSPKILTSIKNAYLLFFSEPLFTCLIFYLTAVPMIIFFVFQDQFFVYLLLLIMAVYGFGFVFEIITSRLFYLFDEYVNKKYYPDLYEKNLDIIKEK